MADLVFPGATPAPTVLGLTRMPKNLDLAIWQGDATRFIAKLTDANGALVDLAGSTPSAVIRQDFTSPDEWPFATTIVNGEIDLYLSSPVTKSMPAGSYIWNLQVTNAEGDTRTYLAGDVTVYAEVDH